MQRGLVSLDKVKLAKTNSEIAIHYDVFYLSLVGSIIDLGGGGSEEAGHISHFCNTTRASTRIGTYLQHDSSC